MMVMMMMMMMMIASVQPWPLGQWSHPTKAGGHVICTLLSRVMGHAWQEEDDRKMHAKSRRCRSKQVLVVKGLFKASSLRCRPVPITETTHVPTISIFSGKKIA
jgi:hypothetical protein